MILPPKSNFDLSLSYGDQMAANAHQTFTGGNLEVKTDKAWHKNLNACFEVLRNEDTKTGLLSTESTDWHHILPEPLDENKILLSLTWPVTTLKRLLKDRLTTGRARVQPGCGDGKRTICVLVPICHLLPAKDYQVTRDIAKQRRFNGEDELTQRIIEYLK